MRLVSDMTIWDSLGLESSGADLPCSDLKTPMNKSPLAWAPPLICHSLGSHAAFGFSLPYLECKQVCSYHTAEQKQTVAKIHLSVPDAEGRCSLPQTETWPPAQVASRPAGQMVEPSVNPSSWVLI